MTNKSILLSLSLLWLFFACDSGKKQSETANTSKQVEEEMAQATEITISPVNDSPEFPDAILDMNTPEDMSTIEPGPVAFDFEVTNYQLTAKTADADMKMCANSAKGQHIHLILNNAPYTAHYEASFEKEMEPGHYVALAFLSRSYHESLKDPEAYVIRQFTVGDVEAEPADLTTPHMFYSRPKGTYTGEDTRKILLDFFLLNTDLSPDGNKVRATINGQEFMIDKWQPYFVEGLPMGQNTFKLELLDAEGNLVESPFNPVERTVTLQASDTQAM